MGIETKAIITKANIDEIVEFAKDYFYHVEIESTFRYNFYNLSISLYDERRHISVFTDDIAEIDHGIKGTLLTLGCYGQSVEIMKLFLNEFGGYLQERDNENQDFYPFNIEKYEINAEFTEHDYIINEVVSELGYKNLSKFLTIFFKYKDKI